MQREEKQLRKRRLSLSVYVSGLLMLIAILPLIITVSIIELISRPNLIIQASRQMETDAQARTQSIDNYFAERLLEAESLSKLPAIQGFLVGDQGLQTKAYDGLATGHGRGSYYEDWSLFDLRGNLQMYYPTTPQKHGNYFILPEDQQQLLLSKKSLFSDVFFKTSSKEAYIDIYSPVVTAAYQLVGILRTSFDLHYIWSLVDNENGANGQGSYAFILNQQGVRIAYTNPVRDAAGLSTSPYLFKAIASLSPEAQQRANSEELYGSNGNSTTPVLADDALSTIQQRPAALSTFQIQPVEQHETFQIARSTLYTVPWSYFVLSPLSTVTKVADQQLVVTLIVTFIVLVLAALLGIGLGQRITRPILSSVDALLKSSQSLKILSSKEQSAAQEQTWVVEASQIGLHKVEYYSNASNVAAHRLSEIGTDLLQRWEHLDAKKAKQALQEIITTARYIENVRKYQDESNKSLAVAIHVTTQVSEQLSSGATSAAEAATQLEQVVNQLRTVVGK